MRQSSLVARRADISSLEPRGLTRRDAAAYCGLSSEGFNAWVKRGIVPGPIPGTQRWDRRAIDLALDRASGIVTIVDGAAYDNWRTRREGANARR
jgi:hypothetical protein